VIYVELSKLNEIIKKSVDDMTDLEKWAVFFRYADIPEYRETVNKVIETKEALQMAGNLLMSVSKDENERAILRSRRKYQSDMESNIATAEHRGKLIVASNLLKRNRPIDEIIEDTGLTRKEVENLIPRT
jgi:predicted transposase/invertase (TIGR01784 family)